jgi:MoaA/NifB/PqqE/SkfB family radical SAM enzyme
MRESLKQKSNLRYLTKQEIESICKSLSTFGRAKNVNLLLYLTGGEPLLRREWFDLAPTLKSMGFYLAVDTNGTLLNKKLRNVILRFYKSITFSIDGEEETHDILRGKNKTYRKMIKNLTSLLDERKQANTDLIVRTNTVLTSLVDEAQLMSLIEHLVSLGVDELRFKPMMYDVDSDIFKNYGLTEKRGIELMRFLWELRKKYPQINITKDYLEKTIYMIKCMDRGTWSEEIPQDCPAGKQFFFIDAYGGFWPCCAFSPRPPEKAVYYKEALVLLREGRLHKILYKMRFYSRYSCPLCNERFRHPLVERLNKRLKASKVI